MTSPTERLRALLDDRGVEWWQSANTLGCIFTRWHSPLFGDEVCAMENGEEGLVLFDHFLTPEQAVAATLGAGTCSDTGECMLFCCSECGFGIGDIFVNSEKKYIYDGTFPRFCPWCGNRVVRA